VRWLPAFAYLVAAPVVRVVRSEVGGFPRPTIALMPVRRAQCSSRVRAMGAPGRSLGEDLRVAVIRAARQVVEEPARLPDGIVVDVQLPSRQMIIVGIHPDTARRQCGIQGELRHRRGLPAGGEVPAVAVRVVADGVGHGPIVGDPVGPLPAPV
jgi:hypothetical protein